MRLDGEPVDPDGLDLPAEALDGAVLQVGKRRHRRLERAEPAPVRELRTATLLHSSVPVGRGLARPPAGGYTCWSRLKRRPRRGESPAAREAVFEN